MIHYGIDPGLSGGFARFHSYPMAVVEAFPMPVKGGEIDAGELGNILLDSRVFDDVIVIVEVVHSMPKQGVASTFKFGKGYGKILGMLEALGIHYELVTPQVWKAVVLAGTPKDKDAAVAWCRRAYPAVNLVLPRCQTAHDGMADALCIAEYGRRTFR